MTAKEIIAILTHIVEEHGDLPVATFNLDRDVGDVLEVAYGDLPYEHIYIG